MAKLFCLLGVFVVLCGCAAMSHGGADVCAVAEAIFCPVKEVSHGTS